MNNKLKTASLCVQGGYKAGNGEPIELPIIQSTTFKYDNSEEMALLFDLKRTAISTPGLPTPPTMRLRQRLPSLREAWGQC